MEYIVVILLVGVTIWAFYQSAKNTETVRSAIIAQEGTLMGQQYSPENLQSYGPAKYNGSYSLYPRKFTTIIYTVGSSVYFTDGPNIVFRIDAEKVTDFGIIAPDMPYVMNLNVAGVLANEMTRREAGTSVYMVFASGDDYDAARVDEMNEVSANHLTAFIRTKSFA